jgi:hypothetical protein
MSITFPVISSDAFYTSSSNTLPRCDSDVLNHVFIEALARRKLILERKLKFSEYLHEPSKTDMRSMLFAKHSPQEAPSAVRVTDDSLRQNTHQNSVTPAQVLARLASAVESTAIQKKTFPPVQQSRSTDLKTTMSSWYSIQELISNFSALSATAATICLWMPASKIAIPLISEIVDKCL